MKNLLDQASTAQLAACEHLLDTQSYAAAAAALARLAPHLLKNGSTQLFLSLWQRLPEHEREHNCALLLAAGDAWRLHDNWLNASLCYQRAQHLAEASADLTTQAQALSSQALVCWQRGDVEGAAALYEQAQSVLAAIADADPVKEEVRSGYALVLSSLGCVAAAETLLQQQIRAFQRHNDIAGQRMTLHNLGLMVYLRRGNFQAAEAVLREALHLAEIDQQRFGEAYLLNSLAYTLNWQDRADEALALSVRAQALGEALAVPNIVAFAWLNQAQALHSQGATTAAAQACAQARAALHSAQSAPLQCDILLVEAQLQQRHCPTLAGATAQAALAAARVQGDQWLIALCWLRVAELHLLQDDSDAAQAALAEAHPILARYEDQYHLLHWHLLCARLAHDHADWPTLSQQLQPLLAGLSRYAALLSSVAQPVALLLAAALQHDSNSPARLHPLAVTCGSTFAPLAASLLRSPAVAVRHWTIRVLAVHDAAWSWALLAAHHEPVAALQALVQTALGRAACQPLPELELRCLGDFAVDQGGMRIPADRWVSLHAQIVLIYLVLRGSATRDELIDLLWPDGDLHKTTMRLRSTLRLLRKALCPAWQPDADYVLYQNECYRLDPLTRIRSDLQQFQQWIARARASEGSARYSSCAQALTHYRGSLLPGSYNEWVLQQREQLLEDWLWAQEEQIVDLLHNERLAAAESQARQVIRIDPSRERAWQMLLQSLRRQNRRAEAARMHQVFAQQLVDTFGITSAPEIKPLLAS